MNTKKLLIYAVLILLLPTLPLLISKGWERRLDAPQKAAASKMQNISEYADAVIKVNHNGIVLDIPLFEYICGVVSKEMPASYEKEALKAQAVAACSYTVYRMEAVKDSPGLFPEHGGAYVCTDPNHCKAYADSTEQRSMWGESYEQNSAKIQAAVSEVLGYILTYEGEPANAVFHAISSGKTESAKDIWGSDIPYLISVDSRQDELSEGFETTLTLGKDEALSAINTYMGKDFDELTVGDIKRTEAGSVKEIILCNESFSGAAIREIFALRSENFSVTQTEDELTFTVKGYGHGVGMSQFGANQMAKEGATYSEILRKYYNGTVLQKYSFR